MTNDRIGNIIASLTLEEKASLASGKSFWETQDIPAKGVPSIWLADGPHGLRKEDRLHIRENGGHSVKATCFPTASALACAWSPALARRVGGHRPGVQDPRRGRCFGAGRQHQAQPAVRAQL